MSLFNFAKRFTTKSAIFAAILATASSASLSTTSWAQSSQDVLQPVEELTHSIEKSLQSNQSYQQRIKSVGDAVMDSYDDEAIMSGSIGTNRFKRLNTQEKQKLVNAFRDYSVGRYVNSFTPGDKLKFKVSSNIKNGQIAGQKEVTTSVVPLDGTEPTEVDYLLHQKDGKWKICDILLTDTHISTVAQQHNDFIHTLKTQGVDGLVNSLEKKAQNSKLN